VKFRNITAIAAFVACGFAGQAKAQQAPAANPPVGAPAAGAQGSPGGPVAQIDLAAVNAGRLTFVTNCSFCHGSDARGGAEGGPDLTRSPIVAGDPSGQQLNAFLKTGRPPKMPPFSLSDSEVSAVSAFLQSQILTVMRTTGTNAKAMLVGDAKAGEAYFNGPGKCTSCHSITGDLKGIGAKYDPQMLQGRMVLPRGHGGYPSHDFPGQPGGSQDVLRSATVMRPDGQTTSGELLFISDYDVTLRDASGVWHTFARNGDSPKIEIKDPLQAHLDLLAHLTDKDMHDLTAYLVTLK
jgi:cytochrome c oxidase cbb3-type subunit III